MVSFHDHLSIIWRHKMYDDFKIDLVWTKIQVAFTGLGAWLGAFLGGMDGLLYALAIFSAVDYITGVMVAISEKKLSSAVGFRGICRKILLFALVGIAHTLDTHVVGSGSALRTATFFYDFVYFFNVYITLG